MTHTVSIKGLILCLESLLVVLLKLDSRLESLSIEGGLDSMLVQLVALEVPTFHQRHKRDTLLDIQKEIESVRDSVKETLLFTLLLKDKVLLDEAGICL